MSPIVLVINAGSSSIKYQLLTPGAGAPLAAGKGARIGEDESYVEHTVGQSRTERRTPVKHHGEGLRQVFALFDEVGPDLHTVALSAVGHRVVQGGMEFDGPVRVDDAVLATIERLTPLAPLHNPAGLLGIRVARELLPDVPHVAVFDTAFFQALPAAAATYALEREVAEKYAVRRYGAHGTSHQYVAGRTAELLGREDLRQIVLHLGDGASASAVVGGKAVETSMGLTPLEGLVMGTRTGDIDPAVVFHLSRSAGMSTYEIDRLFNQRSGLKGLTGELDLREVHRLISEGDARARAGLDVYLHRLRKYVGAYAAVMGGLDALTFTAGVGENDAVVRAGTVAGLQFLGIELDPEKNATHSKEARFISPVGAMVAVLVIPTNEELAIARLALSLL
jgi:acetate kinase